MFIPLFIKNNSPLATQVSLSSLISHDLTFLATRFVIASFAPNVHNTLATSTQYSSDV